MTTTRRNELIRIATNGKELHQLKPKTQVNVLWALKCWEDDIQVSRQYELKEQQENLLR